MTTKAYIVANEQQERDVLEKLESQDIIWKYSLSHKTAQFTPSRYHNIVTFPYILKVIGSTVRYGRVSELDENEIVYDGRKEEHMSEKYVVSQEFMNELEDWKLNTVDGTFINGKDINNLPYTINNWWCDSDIYNVASNNWWCDSDISNVDSNNRLIAIIRWLNGEDVFEVEKSKKWAVISKSHDAQDNGVYIKIEGENYIKYPAPCERKEATRFDTKEEAESWANAHQEVIEVED